MSGPMAQALERVRAKAAGGHDVIEIDRGAAEEGEGAEEKTFVTAPHDWENHEQADRTVNKERPHGRERRVLRRGEERPAAIGMHRPAGYCSASRYGSVATAVSMS